MFNCEELKYNSEQDPTKESFFPSWVMLFWYWKCEEMERLEYAFIHSCEGYDYVIFWVKVKALFPLFTLARIVSDK